MNRDVTVILSFGSDAVPIKLGELQEWTSYFDEILASGLEQNPGTDVVRIGMVHSTFETCVKYM